MPSRMHRQHPQNRSSPAADPKGKKTFMTPSIHEGKENENGGEHTMNILMVLTSHDQLGSTGRKTGFWLEEFAAPYFVFKDAGIQLTLASPKGGQPPIDPKSDLPENQ